MQSTALLSAMPEISSEELTLIDRYWRAANYLSVGQIYLLDNPLLKEPLKPEHIKPRPLGHWGTTPGLNFKEFVARFLEADPERRQMLVSRLRVISEDNDPVDPLREIFKPTVVSIDHRSNLRTRYLRCERSRRPDDPRRCSSKN